MTHRFMRMTTVLLFLTGFVALFYVWKTGSSGSVINVTGGSLIAYGNLAGLVGFYLALWQLLLIGRVAWIEGHWGHDKLSVVHHYVGTAALAAIALHPVLLSLGYGAMNSRGPVSQFWRFVLNFPDVFWALVAYIMFLAIVGMTMAIIRRRLKYETWYYIHFLLYLAIVLSFGHQISSGRDMYGAREIFWNGLFYGVLVIAAYYRFVRPLVNFKRFDFRVGDIENETSDIYSMTITGRGLKRFRAKAGQFVVVRFLAKGFWTQAHPFSLSEVPHDDRLRLTIKASGDFTSKMRKVPAGTRILVEGPLGMFTADRLSKKKALLIAGGVGIAPLRALFDEFFRRGKVADMLYSARTEDDFALKDELDELSRRGAGRVVYFTSSIKGHMTADAIKDLAPDVSERTVFLCGPPAMMKAVAGYLKELGVSSRDIIFEEFKLA